ncbi:unnamed protein product (macronuclear) [Paramecium tetraurelia]|uniref:PHD-type domain-containing protein n=1 Tax=Paramecium tetraurelia TaxID=5888 RepID=A0BZ14_PARTE|nr:uncharacterized protein GSPATT00033634001 [Paramecium tetraurelia]CAK63781.1 unnamed protein product [Paramecium tetraurelia]|eukprot:XP_001431179.1 hypothetical protein (macronuclear) [Paramecium tetraurelia strain d4-2]
MNLYLEQAAEEFEQAISDADQLLALTKATLQKFTNYLKRKQQEKMERRYHLNNITEDSNSMKQLDKQSYNQLKILEYFNKFHKEVDKQLRDLKEMVPSNPQTYVIEELNQQEQTNKQTEQKVPQKIVQQDQKFYPLFKQTRNPGQPGQNSYNQSQSTLGQQQTHLQLQVQQLQAQNSTQFQTQQNQNTQKENNQQRVTTQIQNSSEQQTETIKPILKQRQEIKESVITFGRLQKFQYQKLIYPKQNEGNCAFCGLEANDQNLGSLLLIPSNNNSSQKYQIHEMCGLWSQNLVFFNGLEQSDPKNIDEEVEKSKKTRCFLCSRAGATICCAVCPQSFHFTCLMKSSQTGKLIENQFKFFCDKHKYKARLEVQNSSDEEQQPKKRKKVQSKLNTSKSMIKNSPKRGKSPASQQAILQQCLKNKDDDSKRQWVTSDLIYFNLPQWASIEQKVGDIDQSMIQNKQQHPQTNFQSDIKQEQIN